MFVFNTSTSFIVFFTHLISLEGICSICISVALTAYLHENKADINGDALDWVLLSFAVITPISAIISMAFGRRERALVELASFRASCLSLYQSHAMWGWDWKENTSGRPEPMKHAEKTVNSLQHSDEVMRSLLNLCIFMARYLTLPNCTRARHKLTSLGRKEAEETLDVAAGIVLEIESELCSLGFFCEYLKANGLPGNEAARMRQWERFLSENFEKLRVVKRYRTPQGLRSFGRLFSLFLPPFYAPYYAELARSLNSLGVGLTFAVLTSIALTSLFETASQMEDPFLETSVLDGIQVKQELVDVLKRRMMNIRKKCFPEASPFEEVPGVATLPPTSNKRYSEMRLFTE